MYSTADIFLTKHTVRTDKSLIPIENFVDESFLVYTQNNFRSQVLVGNYALMGEFFLRSDFFERTTSRKFMKVDELLAYIGGFAQVLLLASTILGTNNTYLLIFFFNACLRACIPSVKKYNQYAYSLKLANQLYDFDFSGSTDNTLIPISTSTAMATSTAIAVASGITTRPRDASLASPLTPPNEFQMGPSTFFPPLQ